MHLLPPDTRSLDAAEAAIDLAQSPGDIVFLSFTDSDLSLASSARIDGLRVAPLAKLRHPMSVDLYLDTVCRHAKAIMVRLLGGLDYWRYGAEQLAGMARSQGIALAFIPGDGRPDRRLADLSTVPQEQLRLLERYWRESGAANAEASLRALARVGGLERGEPGKPVILPKHGVHERPFSRTATLSHNTRAAIVFYRSILLAEDIESIDKLIEGLEARGFSVSAFYVSSLKDEETIAWIESQLEALHPSVILNATAFSAQREKGGTALDKADCPVLQVLTVGSSEEAWTQSARGLSASDLAMHVALPELDGRLLAGAISFKAAEERNGLSLMIHRAHPGRIAAVAAKAAAWARLAMTPRAERRIALVVSNYPGAEGRLAHAVGLDAPASVVAILERLADEGYCIENIPEDPSGVIESLGRSTLCKGLSPCLRLPVYRTWLDAQPATIRNALFAAWGDPSDDPSCDGDAFRFTLSIHGRVALAVQPDRGSALDRKKDHHDPDLPPRHAYLAFYLWLREVFDAHAMVHLGTHGTLEWLPGKAAALSAQCFPDLALGPLPVLYPFIVNNPGEAAQAKRRLGAVTIGHMTPPLSRAGLSGEALEVERLLDEYASADGLDKRRMGYLRRTILERALDSGLARQCGLEPGIGDDKILARIDAFLCDVKEMQIREGLHVFGRGPLMRATLLDDALIGHDAAKIEHVAALIAQSGKAEMDSLVAGLDGRFIPPGPAGAPSRGRLDVLPTGRNLTTLDPRAVPTRAAAAIGRRAADEIILRYRQDHGDNPSRIVLDLWGSATLRTGGDDLAQALALLGVAPLWDYASNRVSGFEIVPLAKLDRPRVDVTLRVSGLFRDVFAQQIVLFDEAVRAVAALDEDDAWNPLAAFRRKGETRPLRMFGSAPRAYGAGITDRIQTGQWRTRAELGEDYLTAGGYAYGLNIEGQAAREAFAIQVASADAHVHGHDHAEIDILDDMTFAAFQGGFGAALEALGAKAALYHVDLSDPHHPKLRTLAQEVARVVHGRAANPRWIAGMMRHGYAGGAELANAVDALFAFSATAGVVSDAAFDALHAAYLDNEDVAAFLESANPAALGAIRAKLAEAIQRGLWRPRLNSVSRLLDGAMEAAE